MVPAFGAGAGPLEQPRQFGEDGRRIALVVGGSPTERPISRCAMAKRVTESISSSTSLPSSRKYSATRERQIRRLAAHGAGSSEVATTTTERGALLAEIVLEEFLHFAAAFADQADHRDVGRALRASIDISTDLPTPEPAKMPMRWPRHRSAKMLSARTPRSSGRRRAARMRGRRRGERIGAGPAAAAPCRRADRRSVDHAAEPSARRAHGCRAEFTTTVQPCRTPSSGRTAPAAHPPRKPTTSHGCTAPAGSMIARAPTARLDRTRYFDHRPRTEITRRRSRPHQARRSVRFSACIHASFVANPCDYAVSLT